MKTFKSFEEASKWLQKVATDTEKEAIEQIAREEYKDSKKYTYLDTEEMYDSGMNSNFAEGEVVLKAPQVRWLYYTTWIKPRHNMSAVPQWHEATKRENIGKYKKMYADSLNKKKKE